MNYNIIFCAVTLIARLTFANLPSLEILNSGVFTQSLKHLPSEFENIEEVIFVQRGGTVIPANSIIYVAADRAVFRS